MLPKKESTEKNTAKAFLLKETTQNTSFLSSNEQSQNKNIFNTLKNNVGNYRRSSILADATTSKNTNCYNFNNDNKLSTQNNLSNYNIHNAKANAKTNVNNEDEKINVNMNMNMNYTKKASDLYFNSKKTFVEPNNLKINNKANINPIKPNSQNLNITQLNENKTKSVLDYDDKMNMLNKVKSTTNLPNFYRSSYFNVSNMQKINDNYLTNLNNHTGLNFAETPIRGNILESNISCIKEGKSLYLNLGRLYDEKELERSKSPTLINQNNVSHLSTNKEVIKNIETNVSFKFI